MGLVLRLEPCHFLLQFNDLLLKVSLVFFIVVADSPTLSVSLMNPIYIKAKKIVVVEGSIKQMVPKVRT
jgi:hypothetical protein